MNATIDVSISSVQVRPKTFCSMSYARSRLAKFGHVVVSEISGKPSLTFLVIRRNCPLFAVILLFLMFNCTVYVGIIYNIYFYMTPP